MQYYKTTATKKIVSLTKRIRAVCGGTAASKTISILLYLIARAQTDEKLLISIVSESLPHLKRGAMRDFLNIMQGHNYYEEARWNRTDSIYTFETGSRIEFFGVDSPDKVRGPRRDILFMNEANNCPYNSFDQLEVRTRDEIWLDWNPVNEFWFYTEILPHRKIDTEFITLTYKDNEALEDSIVKSIEARRDNKTWWRVYGEGMLGEFEGQIYRDWAIIEDIPHEARLERYGMDFGYSADPAAIVALYRYDGGWIIDEIAFSTGLSNKQLADIIENTGKKALVIADSAEPKSIDEIRSYGITVLPSEKGQGSVNAGIAWVQSQRISITARSLNVIKEYRNYLWKTDRDGKQLNVPEHDFSHSQDAIRYALWSMRGREDREPIVVRQKHYDEFTGRLLS